MGSVNSMAADGAMNIRTSETGSVTLRITNTTEISLDGVPTKISATKPGFVAFGMEAEGLVYWMHICSEKTKKTFIGTFEPGSLDASANYCFIQLADGDWFMRLTPFTRIMEGTNRISMDDLSRIWKKRDTYILVGSQRQHINYCKVSGIYFAKSDKHGWLMILNVLPLPPGAEDYVKDQRWQVLKNQFDALSVQIQSLEDEIMVLAAQDKKSQKANDKYRTESDLRAKRAVVADQMETVKVSYQTR